MASILLVDDDHSMLIFIEKALKHAGYEVTTAHNGSEALDIIATSTDTKFDLLLTDIIMPGMDGVLLSQKVMKNYPDLKVMFMTGFSAIAMNTKNLNEDVKMMSKPFHLNDLIDQIEKTLNS